MHESQPGDTRLQVERLKEQLALLDARRDRHIKNKPVVGVQHHEPDVSRSGIGSETKALMWWCVMVEL